MAGLFNRLLKWWRPQESNREEIPQHLQDALLRITEPEDRPLMKKLLDKPSEINDEELNRCLKIAIERHEKQIKPVMDAMVWAHHSVCLF